MTPRAHTEGFTIVELVVVMIIIGVLAAYALPRMVANGEMGGIVFRDRVVSGLRLAQKTAVGHRRLVCVATSSSAIVLRIATTAPATACDSALTGESATDFATTDSAVGMAGTGGVFGTTLYFQPNGDITTDGAGETPASGTLTVNVAGTTSTPAAITIEGMTGYVD